MLVGVLQTILLWAVQHTLMPGLAQRVLGLDKTPTHALRWPVQVANDPVQLDTFTKTLNHSAPSQTLSIASG